MMDLRKLVFLSLILVMVIPVIQGYDIDPSYAQEIVEETPTPVAPPSNGSEPPESAADQTDQEECLVPCDEIVSGGPGKDGIPAIDEPIFENVEDADLQLSDSDIVLAIDLGGEVKVYPYDILNWHEIVNDIFEGVHTSVTYCPLTGTGIVYKVSSSISDTTLGVSGKLYENNLVFYDRDTDTYYSQMKGVGIKGENIGTVVQRTVSIETTWSAIKSLYPDAQVLSRETGYSRNYASYPYGGYQTDDSIYFKSAYLSNTEIRDFYHPKTLTVILDIGNSTHLISFNELAAQPVMEVEDYVIFHEFNHRTSMVFDPTLDDGTKLTFKTTDASDLTSGLIGFIDDQTESTWNILGTAVDGDLKGTSLNQVVSYNAFWFAAVAFFPNGIIHLVNGTPYTPTLTPNFGSTTEESPVLLTPFLFLIPITLWIIRRRR